MRQRMKITVRPTRVCNTRRTERGDYSPRHIPQTTKCRHRTEQKLRRCRTHQMRLGHTPRKNMEPIRNQVKTPSGSLL